MEDRNITKMDVEFYLLNREYSELNAEEHAIVKEYVESEQDFNEMKAVLMGAGDFFKEEKELEPNPAIKAALLKEFDKQQPAGAYWLNGIFVSLFPKEKKIFQKPGMQLIGLAASVLLVLTIVFNGENNLNNSTLAQNDELKTEEEAINELEKKELDVEKTLLEDEIEAPHDVLEKEVEIDGLTEVEEEMEPVVNVTSVGGVNGFTFDAQPMEDNDNNQDLTTIDQELDNRSNNSSVKDAEGYYRKENAKADNSIMAEDEKLVISATTLATSEIAEEVAIAEADYFADDVTVATGTVTAPGVSSNMDLPVNSRTLAEDADLIGILYTAM